MHPDDIELYELADPACRRQDATSIDQAFRMRHANGRLGLAARALRTGAPPRATPATHLIGIAVDVTEQMPLVEKTAAADMRLRDAIETISEAFVLWDADNRLVMCNSKFQQLHNLPDARSAPARPTKPCRGRPASRSCAEHGRQRGPIAPGARTFEAQLEDGRWLQINERRTKDGGFVSVGTDITALKRHEERLLESERRLMATITDLRTRADAGDQTGSSPISPRNTPTKRPAPRTPTRRSPNSSPT